MEKRTKNILIVGGIILIAILAIFFIGKATGKNKAKRDKPNSKDLPNSGSGIPQNWDPETLANELHDLMEGAFDSISQKNEAMGKLANLGTSDMVVAVYNIFNSKYSKGPDDTLTTWIRNEFLVGPNQALALNRLQVLNLP